MPTVIYAGADEVGRESESWICGSASSSNSRDSTSAGDFPFDEKYSWLMMGLCDASVEKKAGNGRMSREEGFGKGSRRYG